MLRQHVFYVTARIEMNGKGKCYFLKTNEKKMANKLETFSNLKLFRSANIRQQEGSLTAASLIDAIITHQISQATPEPPMTRDGHRPSIVRELRHSFAWDTLQ